MFQHYTSLDHILLNNAWVTIGSFDGVHLGHQKLLHEVTSGAHAVGVPGVVLTFHPSPAVVLGRRTGAYCIDTTEERIIRLEAAGVDAVITLPFDLGLAETSARDFLIMLHSCLRFTHLFVGCNFAFGRNREGNVATIENLAGEIGFQVHATDLFSMEGEVLSSSRVRQEIARGNVETVERWLGRAYQLCGQVMTGDQRGRTLGFPTANLSSNPCKIIPTAGVYACQVVIDKTVKAAAVNIGVRPTFDRLAVAPHVEAHILDYSGDLYGKTICLQFLRRLRDERRFPDVSSLIRQLHQDVEQTRKICLEK